MEAPQNFRSAFNGFNREDVVNYISFISTKHESQLNDLRSEAEELRAQLEAREDAAVRADLLGKELETAKASAEEFWTQKQALEEQLASLREQLQNREQENARNAEETERLREELASRDAELEALRGEVTRAAAAPVRTKDSASRWAEELNAYRRAESCERRARERVNEMYDRANGALAEASVRVEQTVGQITELAAKVETDVAVLLKAMADSESALADTAVMLGAIRPDMD